MDPSSRRARNVVLLVVVGVALPSLLLTGLAGVAVSNEAAAAQKRLEAQFHPVVTEAAKTFNGTLESLVAEGETLLPRLVAWAEEAENEDGDEPAAPAPGLPGTLAEPFAVNAFVVSEDGEVLLPQRPPHGEDPKLPLPAAVKEALSFEVAHEGAPEACERWGKLAGTGCVARLAGLLCRHGGAPPADWGEQLGPECAGHARDPLAARAWTLRRAARDRVQSREAYAEEAERLVAASREPAPTSSWLLAFLASEVAARLLKDEGTRPQDESALAQREIRVRRTLLSLAERPALLAQLTRLSHVRDASSETWSVVAEGWHRVVLTRSARGVIAGYELVGPLLELPIHKTLAGLSLPTPADAVVWPVLPPPGWTRAEVSMKELEDQVIAYVLLKRSGLAWSLVFTYGEKGGLFSLSRSRSGLYLWSLLLLLVSLGTGIVYTVRAVVREARLSRLKVDFVSSVSHDLRTPLTSIRMFTETLLLGRVKSEAEAKECLGVIAQETERLSRLAQRILDFSRMEAGRKAYTPAPARISELVAHALAACRPLIEEGKFQVEQDLAPDADEALVDRDAIIEVLINLLTNAIKYSPDERYLRVATRRGADGEVLLSVTDRGIGIPKDEQGKIFEKFHRVDCRRTTEVGGCGIGLSLVQHIVRAHQGEVRVQSELGKGSTFTVSLPAKPPSAGGLA